MVEMRNSTLTLSRGRIDLLVAVLSLEIALEVSANLLQEQECQSLGVSFLRERQIANSLVNHVTKKEEESTK